jgi:hypothetical protein
MNPTFTTLLAADFTGEHVSVEDVGALRARAEPWEATANTWRAFAVDVARVVGTDDPDDVGIEDLRGLAGAVERLRARAEAAEAALASTRAEADRLREVAKHTLSRAHVAEAALATARAEGAAAERARILAVIRERAASRRAQMRACTETGGHIDALAAKESECGALAAIIDGTATMPRWPGRPVEGA